MRPKTDLSRARFTLSTKELAHVMGVDDANVKRYAIEGMPKEARGKWYLPACVQWLMHRSSDREEEIDYDLATRRASLYESQEQRNRIEIAERLGQLIPADEVDASFAQLAQAFVDGLESIPSRIDAAPETISAVEAEIRAARRDLAEAVRNAQAAARRRDRDPHTTNGSGE